MRQLLREARAEIATLKKDQDAELEREKTDVSLEKLVKLASAHAEKLQSKDQEIERVHTVALARQQSIIDEINQFNMEKLSAKDAHRTVELQQRL
jgi:hypothetical protein